MDLMSIGELARLSRLSAKAVRLHDELGLLPPARGVICYAGTACGTGLIRLRAQ